MVTEKTELCNAVDASDHSSLLEVTMTNDTEATYDNNDEELDKIGKMLVGKCCAKLCLRYLKAMDIITSKVDFLPLKDTECKQYLFNKLKENSCEVDPQNNKIVK